MRILAASAITAAAFALMTAGCAFQLEEDADPGGIAADFELYTLEGERVVLSDLLDKGNNVILAFWTTWCPGCVQAVPGMREFHREHGEDVSLISINIGEGESAVRKFAGEQEIGFRIALDADGSVARSFNVVGVPAYIVLQPDGGRIYTGHDFGNAVREAGF